MDARKFSVYNIAGSLAWGGSIGIAGFLLGENLWVRQNLEKIILGIVVITTAPVLLKMAAGTKKTATAVASGRSSQKVR